MKRDAVVEFPQVPTLDRHAPVLRADEHDGKFSGLVLAVAIDLDVLHRRDLAALDDVNAADRLRCDQAPGLIFPKNLRFVRRLGRLVRYSGLLDPEIVREVRILVLNARRHIPSPWLAS